MDSTPAWYIIRSNSLWARWFNLLHWPYTLWNVSYVAMGASLAPVIDWQILGWSLLAFFLAIGIGAHATDMLAGDPLRLSLKRAHLWAAALVSVGLAIAIGAVHFSLGDIPLWTVMFIPVGATLAIGYGLEWPGLHGDNRLALWAAVFPALVGYFAQDQQWSWALVPLAVFAFAMTRLQRVLSTRSKLLRRKAEDVKVTVRWKETGRAEEFDGAWLLRPVDVALGALSLAMPVLAVTMVLSKV